MEKLPPFLQSVQEHPVHGRLATLLLPSGNSVVIREQNGNDDDVISSMDSSKSQATPFNRFIAGIICEQTFPFVDHEKSITPKEVLEMPLRDKYYILMASRAFSISPILKFQWDWRDGKAPVHYEEDLTPYLPNYKEELPEPQEPGYFKYRIEPYLHTNPFREISLQSGKKVKYKWLDGHGEVYMLNLPEDKANINTQLRSRFIQLYDDKTGQWFDVHDFRAFNSRDMQEIRFDIEENDKPFDGLTDIKNPYSGNIVAIPLLSIPDFFFPRQI